MKPLVLLSYSPESALSQVVPSPWNEQGFITALFDQLTADQKLALAGIVLQRTEPSREQRELAREVYRKHFAHSTDQDAATAQGKANPNLSMKGLLDDRRFHCETSQSE